ILPPRSSFWYSTESTSTLRYAMPSLVNSLRTDQQNSHHSSANITTDSSSTVLVTKLAAAASTGTRGCGTAAGAGAAGAGAGAGASKRHSGVERDTSHSSAVISS